MSKGKVLVVNDDHVFARILERQLIKLDYEVVTISDNLHSIDELTVQNSFDLAVVDYYLGDVERGVDLPKRYPGLKKMPLIFISDSQEQSVLDEILSVSPDGFIDKSRLNPRELQAMMNLVLYKKQKEEELKELNENLDLKVKDQTKKLNEAVKALVREVAAKEEAHQKLEKALKTEKEFGALKSDIVSNLSHEFKTPISFIKSSAQIIKRILELNDEDDLKLFKHSDRIMEGADRLNSLLTRILLVEKNQLLEFDREFFELDIRPIFDNICDKLESVKLDVPKLNVFSKYGFERATINPDLLELVLTNLVSNALKFTLNSEPVVLYFETDLADDTIKIKVLDRGIGISKEDLDQIYFRFFRGKNVGSVEGTGIGMSIVKRALNACNGTISIKSELNKGTTVLVEIPVDGVK